MTANVVKDLLLYRYRYVVGYVLLVVLAVGLTVWRLGDIPPGFSELEKQSAVISSKLAWNSESFINLPYHLLQQGSLLLFGPTAWGIRLPSVLLGLMLAAASYFLLKRWFGGNSAVIGTILVITSVYFLVRARTGAPLILYYLWPALLLLTATLAHTQVASWRLWLWVFTVVAGLSLYTPYLGFFLVIVGLAAMASRAGRAFLAEVDGPAIALSLLTLAVLLVPLGYSIYQQPQLAFDYIGTIQTPTLGFLTERFQAIAHALVGYGAQPGVFYPVLGLPALALGLFGLYHAARHIGRTRYAIAVLWLFTAVALFVSSSAVPTAILFVPLALLVIIGLWRFITVWYELFPRNPYARIAALLPIALLLFTMVQFNYQRYFYGLPRSDDVRAAYDSDILLLQRQLSKDPRISNLLVVVEPSEESFMSLVESRYRLVNVVTPKMGGINYTSDALVVTEPVRSELPSSATEALSEREVELVVDDRPDEGALRFRAYK